MAVNVNTMIDYSDYEFITKPPKLPWNKDISYRFENILQTQEFSSRLNSYLNQDFSSDQTGIDQATEGLSSLLIEGALRSDHSVRYNDLTKPTLKECSKGKKKKRKSHPKWHDLSCAEAHRDVLLTSKLLKINPKMCISSENLSLKQRFIISWSRVSRNNL